MHLLTYYNYYFSVALIIRIIQCNKFNHWINKGILNAVESNNNTLQHLVSKLPFTGETLGSAMCLGSALNSFVGSNLLSFGGGASLGLTIAPSLLSWRIDRKSATELKRTLPSLRIRISRRISMIKRRKMTLISRRYGVV